MFGRHSRLRRSPATVKDAIGDLGGAINTGVDAHGFDYWKISRHKRPSEYSQALRTPDRTFSSHRSTQHSAAVVERFSKVLPGGLERIGRHPRLKWNGQCPTLRAGTGADKGSFQAVRPIHPQESRVITVREAARLQGFPDRHLFHSTIWHSFRMIGNSVSPIVSTVIFSVLADKLNLNRDLAKAA